MKKYASVALALVLTATLFTGCRMKNDDSQNTSAPTILPTTTAPTMASTTPSTAPSTAPATSAPTAPTESQNDTTENTAGDNGFVEQDPTGNTGSGNARGRRGMGNIQ